MRNRKNAFVILMAIACVLINLLGNTLAEYLSLPIWLDSVGTIIMAYTLGPVCGTMVGVAGNLLYTVFFGSSIFYGLVSVAIGVTVGVCSKKGFMNTVFGALSTAFLVTIFSVIISTPISLLLANGSINNIWGDSVRRLLNEMGVHPVISRITGQLYVEFLDKVISIMLLYLLIRIVRKLRIYLQSRKDKKQNNIKSAGIMLTMLTASLLIPHQTADAAVTDAPDFSGYIQTVYNNDDGLTAGIANDILQTNDGVLWIGTYNGLYRYNGINFQWMNEMESVKTVNCLYTDEAGRMWIGTNDNGVSICIDQEIVNVINHENGLSSNAVRCINESSDGYYYVGTTDSLAVLRLSNGLEICKTLPEIVYAKSISSDKIGNTVAVTDSGKLFLIRGTEIKGERLITDRSYTCCAFDESGILYAGTSAGTIETFGVSESGLSRKAVIECSGSGLINSINFTGKEGAYICSDNGIGYLNHNGHYSVIETNGFDRSVEHTIVDYQGNLWFTSSRLGLLRMCPSVFTEMYNEEDRDEIVVNTVTEWNGCLFVGTDSGLDVVDKSLLNEVSEDLIGRMDGTRIRCLFVDSRDKLWICTSGMGVIEAGKDGQINIYNTENGTAGDKFRTVIERKDGSMAAAGDSGITFIRGGKVVGGLSAEDGLKNPKILSLYETESGDIYAGTDGNGIVIVRNGEIVGELKKDTGLSSEVILRMIKDAENSGLFIVTGTGLCYMNKFGEIRPLDNFPYYNNYDIVEGNDGDLFVTGSAGIYVVDKEHLLADDELKYELLNTRNGLRSLLTPNSWNYVDENDNLYLSGSTGIVRLNLNRYNVSVRSYHMLLETIKIDGKTQYVSRGETISIPRQSVTVELMPEVVNYSVNDPNVSLYLEGYDDVPKIMPISKLRNIIYSNLPSGEYTFHIAVLDNDTGDVLSENTYDIIKEKEFYDNVWFKTYMIVVGAIFVSYITWMFFRTQVQKTLRLQKLEIEQTKKQIRMGNETIITIAKAVDAKDENTSQHSSRVAEYSVLIAKELGFNKDRCEKLRQTALLHDIGKIGIPDSILNKPAKLTDSEYEIMKSHVTRGAEILKHFTLIDDVGDGAMYHHERYDGRGYVKGLKGEEIPLNARIIGIADAFDAMTANRVYRKKLDIGFVIEELKRCRGTQFDPHLVDIMLKLIDNGTIDVERLYNSSVQKSGGEEQ